MLGRLVRLFSAGRSQDVTPAKAASGSYRSALPHELTVAFESAQVFWRPSRDDDDDAKPILMVVGLGRWAFDGLEEAVERVSKAYPELPRSHCLRAAKLIQAQIGRRNRQVFRGQRSSANSLDRALEDEHNYFGGVFRDR